MLPAMAEQVIAERTAVAEKPLDAISVRVAPVVAIMDEVQLHHQPMALPLYPIDTVILLGFVAKLAVADRQIVNLPACEHCRSIACVALDAMEAMACRE